MVSFFAHGGCGHRTPVQKLEERQKEIVGDNAWHSVICDATNQPVTTQDAGRMTEDKADRGRKATDDGRGARPRPPRASEPGVRGVGADTEAAGGRAKGGTKRKRE